MKLIDYNINKDKGVLTISEGEVSYEDLTDILQRFVLGDKSNVLEPRTHEDFIIFNKSVKITIK